MENIYLERTIDTGIFQRMLRLDLSRVLFMNDFDLYNTGSMAELHAGLGLIKISPFIQQQLFFR